MPNGNTGTMIELGNLPGGNGPSQANALDNSSAIAGGSVTATGQHAFLWTPANSGTMLDLGDLSGGNDLSMAYGINSANRVVGNSNTADSDHAFVWSSNMGLRDLNLLTDHTGTKWTLRFAQAINDPGQIAGWGNFDPDGPDGINEGTHAYRLEPIAESLPGQLYPRRDATGALALHFAAIDTNTYQLETAPTPSGPWQTEGAPFPGNGGIINFQPGLSSTHTCWRIIQTL